jgi:hypothetical protein
MKRIMIQIKLMVNALMKRRIEAGCRTNGAQS